jgi:hypothetical protein
VVGCKEGSTGQLIELGTYVSLVRVENWARYIEEGKCWHRRKELEGVRG